jgi:hypothetical protein
LLEWESPPDERRAYRRNRYVEELRQLCLNPGKWARIDTFSSAPAAHSSRNNLRYAVTLKRYRVPEEAVGFNFDLKVRRLPDGQTWGLYACAVPKEEEKDVKG